MRGNEIGLYPLNYQHFTHTFLMYYSKLMGNENMLNHIENMITRNQTAMPRAEARGRVQHGLEAELVIGDGASESRRLVQEAQHGAVLGGDFVASIVSLSDDFGIAELHLAVHDIGIHAE